MSSSSIDEVVEVAMPSLLRSLNVDYVKVLQLLDEESGMKLQWGLGWDAGYVGEAVVAPCARFQAGFTLTQSSPIVVRDFRRETRFAAPPLLARHDINSGMSVTISGRCRQFGVLGVHCRKERRFTPSEMLFLDCMANVLSAAINERATIASPLDCEPSTRVIAEPANGNRGNRVLKGWKEIAAHLGSGVRTAQRWEQLFSLPVHRPAARMKAAVIASSSELDAWVESSQTRRAGSLS
ncbi:MAG: GAF domain-containing protein [Terriglobia bacterium]|nr:GAF domain-containing protein [Terriglobia bacterium]